MQAAKRAGFLPADVPTNLTAADLRHALAAGWADFASAPLCGLFFAAIYVAGGLAIYLAFMGQGSFVWLVPAAGFPLLAPFTAVGLYEVSRRRELGEPCRWREVLGAIKGRGDGQVLGVGVIVFVIFCFWVILAHGIFYIFLAQAGLYAESLALLATPAGLAMLVVGGAVGGAMALLIFAMTLTGLPMLLDKDVDCISAMAHSVATVKANAGVLLGWALFIAVAMFVAMAPLFLGLLVVLPVLAHASWHLYRRAVP